MDGVQGLSRIPGSHQVTERNAGGNQQQADTFRRAMQQHADAGDGTAAEREPDPSMRRRLQPRHRISRNDEGEAMHVDVLA